jgi:hypothetical protein
LCYNCRRSGHLAKEFPGVGPICIRCNFVVHEVEDCPMIIAKVEGRDIRQENYKNSQETKGMLKTHKEKRSKEVHTMLLQLKKTMDVHNVFSLPEILKAKKCIVITLNCTIPAYLASGLLIAFPCQKPC